MQLKGKLTRFAGRLNVRMAICFALLFALVILILEQSLSYFLQQRLMDMQQSSLIESVRQTVNAIDSFYGTYMAKTDMLFLDHTLSELICKENKSISEQQRTQKEIKTLKVTIKS